MRTVIFLGLMAIANSVSTASSDYSDGVIQFYGIIAIIAMTMDIVDFFRNKT